MSGPASSGQHVWIGRRARATSLPSHTTCWHGAPEISFGAMCITCRPIGTQRSVTSPATSGCERKWRASRYLISLDDRSGGGAVQRDSGPRDSPPYREVGKNSAKNDRADPVVLIKSLEAACAVAAADEAIVMRHD